MTIDTYATLLPLPAPLASGAAFQSYTDPNGDVWVAQGGVNSGHWRRAREVLHARYNRAAAFTTSAGAWASITMDTLGYDDYGLYSTSTGLFTPPVLGMWLLTMSIGATSSAVNQYIQPGVWSTALANAVAQALMYTPLSGAVFIVGTQTVRRITALTDTQYCRVAANAAIAAYVAGNASTYFEAHYLGTG